MLKLDQITWQPSGGEQILKGITMTIPKGRLVVITGPNGGGKTTLAKIIAGTLAPTSGRIYLEQEDITNDDITQRARKGISYAFQQPVRFKGITVRDLLELSSPTPLTSDALCSILGKVGLCAKEYIDREVDASLSGGEIKRIEIATVLARKTKLSIFDEPEAGIDLWSFAGLIDVFKELKTQLSGTLIIISHQERILEIADEIIVVANGLIQKSGPAAEVLPALLANSKDCQCPKKELSYQGEEASSHE